MAYLVHLKNPHRQELINLINSNNSSTIGEMLSLVQLNLLNPRAVAVEEGIPRSYAVTLQNKAYPADTVEVYHNKIALTDIMTMVATDFDGWYDPDTWADGTHKDAALAAFAAAALRANIDTTQILEGLDVERIYKAEENRYYLKFSFTSFVLETGAEFVMPKHFSETVTNSELAGFIYSPIQAAAVVF